MKFIKYFISLILGWVMLSMFAVIPTTMSCPLPEFMLQYRGFMPNTTNTVEKQVEDDLTNAVVKKGYFDDLGLFSNGNFDHGYFTNEKDEDIYIINQIFQRRFDLGREKHYEINTEFRDIVPWKTAVNLGRYFLLYKDDLDGIMYVTSPLKKDANHEVELMIDPLQEDYNATVVYLCELLEKQKKEKITVSELATLIYAKGKGILVFWDEKEHLATFTRPEACEKDPTASHFYVIDTKNMKKLDEYYLYDEEMQVFVSNYERIYYYNEGDKCGIILNDLKEELKYMKLNLVDWEKPSYLNFSFNEDEELVLGLNMDENHVIIYCDREGVEPQSFEVDGDAKKYTEMEPILLTDESYVFFRFVTKNIYDGIGVFQGKFEEVLY